MTTNPCDKYGMLRVLGWAFLAVVLGILIAGFWNYHLVDGFGKDVVAGNTIGNTEKLSGKYGQYGVGLGMFFGTIAGLAATFTACNCVVFAMLPGLVCSTDAESTDTSPWAIVGIFVSGVVLVSALYGLYVGSMGAAEIETYNERANRILQAQVVFSGLGIVMMIWGLFELGLFNNPLGFTGDNTAFKAGTLGVMVGLFAVGRPFPVFRDFLTYAASSDSPLFGAGAMAMQGVGQIAVMVLLFGLIFWLAGRTIARWVSENPSQPTLVSGLALLMGGSFFVFYWGLAIAFDIGQWGFKLGWYS